MELRRPQTPTRQQHRCECLVARDAAFIASTNICSGGIDFSRLNFQTSERSTIGMPRQELRHCYTTSGSLIKRSPIQSSKPLAKSNARRRLRNGATIRRSFHSKSTPKRSFSARTPRFFRCISAGHAIDIAVRYRFPGKNLCQATFRSAAESRLS